MKIVGQVSSPEEAEEMEFIVKMFVVGNRARVLSEQVKKVFQLMKNQKNKKMDLKNKKMDLKNKKTIPNEIPIVWVNI